MPGALPAAVSWLSDTARFNPAENGTRGNEAGCAKSRSGGCTCFIDLLKTRSFPTPPRLLLCTQGSPHCNDKCPADGPEKLHVGCSLAASTQGLCSTLPPTKKGCRFNLHLCVTSLFSQALLWFFSSAASGQPFLESRTLRRFGHRREGKGWISAHVRHRFLSVSCSVCPPSPMLGFWSEFLKPVVTISQ